VIILGIETSCDETAAALVRDGRKVIRSAVASQMSVHRPFRGVVPELASRAHTERINTVIAEALGGNSNTPIDAVAVTRGPGLIGCLLVGAVTAQVLGRVRNIPVIGVNHLEGHLFAGLVEHKNLKPPFLGLIVSGGHTELVIFKRYGRYTRLGATRDDAAGEAFDKVANKLGLSFPGGPAVDRAALKGNPDAIKFPRAWIPGTWDFSFSGLKTSVVNYLEGTPKNKRASISDIAASFQEAVVDVVVQKTLDAAAHHGLRSVVVGGGVAANRRLRAHFLAEGKKRKIQIFLPDLAFCTDNAAMIAAAAYYQLKHGPKKKTKSIDVQADLEITNWK
jgi:N6-L-threonylcarbamoyladenine synthase